MLALLLWRPLPQQVTVTSALCARLGKGVTNHVRDLFFISSLYALHLLLFHHHTFWGQLPNPTMTFVRTCSCALPEPLQGFAWWFAEPGVAPSQWAGILLATMETYNMPGNRGNHRGGDKTHGNWHLSSYSFGKCDMWPSSLILLHLEQHFDSILLFSEIRLNFVSSQPSLQYQQQILQPPLGSMRRRRNAISRACEHRRGVS